MTSTTTRIINNKNAGITQVHWERLLWWQSNFYLAGRHGRTLRWFGKLNPAWNFNKFKLLHCANLVKILIVKSTQDCLTIHTNNVCMYTYQCVLTHVNKHTSCWMCTCLCAVNFLQWRLNAGCIFCFKVNFIAPLPVRHPWQPCAPSSLSFRLPFSFKTSATCQRAKLKFFFWQFLFLYREREKRLCSCFHFTWTLLRLGVMYSYRKPALHCICFALIMCGKWHLICCLFCCSTLAVINLCPLLLFFFFLYIYFCSTHLHSLVLVVHYQCLFYYLLLDD